MPKHRLLITTSTLPRDLTDPEPRFVLDIALQLARHYEVSILAPGLPDGASSDVLGDVTIHRYRYAPVARWQTLTHPGAIMERLATNRARWMLVPPLLAGLRRGIGRLLRAQPFDCVHANWLVPQAAVQGLFFRPPDHPPYLAVSHGADVYAMRGRLGAFLLRAAIKQAAGVICVSEEMRRTLRSRFSEEIGGRPIEIIPQGVDLERFSPAHRTADWAKQLGLERPLILFVGRLSAKKGVEHLIEAMAMEPLASTRAGLAIVGRGPLEDRLRKRCKELALERRVRFLPAATHSSLAQFYASADVLCVPSVTAADGDREGRPTVLIEAAASGLTAVASETGGIADWLEPESNGVLVPEGDPRALANALCSLLAEPERLARLGQQARQDSQKFAWSAVAERYADLTDRTISGHPRT